MVPVTSGSAPASAVSSTTPGPPPKGVVTAKELLDWAAAHGKPGPAAVLPHTQLVYKLSDGTELSAEQLAAMDTGGDLDLGALKVLAKGGIKQQDSPRMPAKDKTTKATFVIKVMGGTKKIHDASIALATSNAIKEATELRQLSLHDAVTLEILAQGYVSHFFKKMEEAMVGRKLLYQKQIRTLRAPGLNMISNATSLAVTLPIVSRIINLIPTYPMHTDLFFLFVIMNLVCAVVAKMINLHKSQDYWERRQILLTLPPEFLNVKAVREIVGIHEEIDTMEKAFMFYAAANPQDEAVWFAHNLEFKIRAAIHAVKARRVVPQETHSDAESTVTTKTAATRSGNQKSKASTTNAKAKAKGRAGNKKQDKENEEPEAEAALGTQSMNQNTLLVEKEESGADQKKRPLQLRSPDAKDFIGEKFSKLDLATAALAEAMPEKYDAGLTESKKTGLGSVGGPLGSILEEGENDMALKPMKLSFAQQFKGDKGKIQMELNGSMAKLAAAHTDDMGAKALKSGYEAWIEEEKIADLKISNILPHSADGIRSPITLRMTLLFLMLIYPGQSLISIICLDLGVFAIWGLPMAQILAIQDQLRNACSRLGSATGLTGDLLSLVVVKAQRVTGLSLFIELAYGKCQGMKTIKDKFQALALVPQKYHHMSATDRAAFVCPELGHVEDMSRAEYRRSLHHDVGLILYCSHFVNVLFKLLFGIRSLSATKRVETAEKYGYATVSAQWSSLKTFKKAVEDANKNKKTEAAIKKMKSDGLNRVEQAVKQEELVVKTCFAEEAEDIFTLCEAIMDSVQRYGCFAAALEDAQEHCSIHKMVKQPTYGSAPYILGQYGERQMDRIGEILKGKTKNGKDLPKQTEREKKAEFAAMLKDIDNWGIKSEGANVEGLHIQERELVGENEGVQQTDTLIDEFDEEIDIGTLGQYIKQCWNATE